MEHRLINSKQYPSVHLWSEGRRMSIMANTVINEKDTVLFEGSRYLVDKMFPDEEEGKLFEMPTTWLVEETEQPYITEGSRFYEFYVKQL